MIALQWPEILADLKTVTRRLGPCETYIVGRSQAVIPKRGKHAIWYYPGEPNKIWHEIAPCFKGSPAIPEPGHGWTQLRALILEKRREQLQDITDAGAIAEGILENQHGAYYASPLPSKWFDTPRDAYANLWDSINKKRGQWWKDNPEIMAVTFARVKP